MRLLITALFTVILSSCSRGNDTASGQACAPTHLTTAANTKVLFIGDSYTYVNCLPDLFKSVAESAGTEVETAAADPGGTSLLEHSTRQATLDLIRSAPWSFVVLQDQSQIPAFQPQAVALDYAPAVVALVNAIHQTSPNAQIVYYVTWARKNGDTMNCSYYPLVCNFDGMTQALYAGYSEYKDAAGGTLANVGGAWKNIFEDKQAPFDANSLWQGDGIHPTIFGSYLAATTIYSTMFGRSPVGVSYPPAISPTVAAYLQKMAGTAGGN